MNTSKSLRLQVGIFGRTNVGKSSFLNLVTSQDVSIVSPRPGTTTDIVEKAMELRPVGPVVFLDTAGVDDVSQSQLSADRVRRTTAVFDRVDVFVVLAEAGVWGEFEDGLCGEARSRGVPVIVVVNKTDLNGLTDEFRDRLLAVTPHVMGCSCVGGAGGQIIDTFSKILASSIKDTHTHPQTILCDLIPPGGIAVLVTPIDSGAPKGRLILPQVQVIRDLLDGGRVSVVARESEYARALSTLNRRPDIVVCDSQVVKQVAELTSPDIRLTTFSVLFARFKGVDLAEAARGAAVIGSLKKGDGVLIAEACAHHAAGDDIGRVKIPRWLRERTGLGEGDLRIDFCGGRGYPDNLGGYSLVIHCGACMLARREAAARVGAALKKNVPFTNYGVAISYFHGVLERVIEPFGIDL